MRTIRSLLKGVVDYAGLFPPAKLSLRAAVRNFDEYRRGEYAWVLGRFVVPVARLSDLEEVVRAPLRGLAKTANVSWRISALAGENVEGDLEAIGGFNERCRRGGISAAVDSIEIKPESPGSIGGWVRKIPASIVAYVEISLHDGVEEYVATAQETGVRAKVRTGGVTASMFPDAVRLVEFIHLCAKRDVPFKATAGLHHPLRSVNRLTYEPDSKSAPMYGFLNVFLAPAFIRAGIGKEEAMQLLLEEDPRALKFTDEVVTWRSHNVTAGNITESRRYAGISFGSCSFEEPIQDLKGLGLL